MALVGAERLVRRTRGRSQGAVGQCAREKRRDRETPPFQLGRPGGGPGVVVGRPSIW
jgi:hypothetical protein